MITARSYWATLLLGIAGCSALYVAIAFIQFGAPTGLTENTERYAIAQERSAAINGRKVLYAGGSSGFYGVRCEELGRVLDRPAVNFGLHAGLGLRYLMDRVVAAAAPGDVIVIGAEWENYSGPRFGEYACDYIMSRRPDYLKSLPLPLAIQLVVAAGPERIFSGMWRRLVPGTSGSIDSEPLRGVNASGDRVITPEDVAHQDAFARKSSADIPHWRPPPRELMNDVDAFVATARAKGVRIVAVFPPLCVSDRIDKANLAATDNGMRHFWADRGVAVLGTIEDALYEPNDAFDTPYHLVAPAALIHTRKLAHLLEDSGVLAD